MLSMLVYFSSAQLAQSQAVAPPALLPLLHVTNFLLCKNRRLFTVAGDNSHVLTPIPMHLIPIPIPFPSHGWSYSHSHGNPMGPMGSQSSPFPCTPLPQRPLARPASPASSATASAGFWLRGSVLPCRLRRRKFGKFGYKMVHSKVCLNKCVVSIAPFSYPAFTPPSSPFRKLVFFACFRFLIFHPFSKGSADPVCLYVRTPMVQRLQNWLPWQRPSRDRKTNFRLNITSIVLPILKIWRRSVQ